MRKFVSVLVVALFGGSALAIGGDVRSAAQQLDSDTSARIAAIGTPPAKGAPANELKNLTKAQAKLEIYISGGVDSVAGFKKIAVAGKFYIASKTKDAAVLADLATVANAMLDGAQNREDNVVAVTANLIDPAHAKAAAAAKALADQLFRQARAAAAKNPAAAMPLIVKIYDLFGYLTFKAQKLVTAEQGATPPTGIVVNSTPNAIQLINTGPTFYDIQKIRVFGAASSGGSVLKTFTGQDAKSLIPGLFAVKQSNRIQAAVGSTPTAFELLAPVVDPLAPAGSSNVELAGELWIYVKGQKFFVVAFDVIKP